MSQPIIGIDLGGTHLRLKAGRHEAQLDTGPLFAPQDLMAHLQAFAARHGLQSARIGLAVPGLVGDGGQVVACDVLPAFTGWQPQHDLASWCAAVAVLNDVQAALLDETHDAPPGLTGAVVMVGTAIGAAFFVDGKPALGTRGWAGELGYLPIALENGQVRRLDELAGGAGLAAACGFSPSQLAKQAAAADPATLKAIANGGRFLGLGLAGLINLLNPSRIAVGGGTAELPGYWQAAQASAQQHALPKLWAECLLEKTRSGANAVVNGALRAAASARG